MAGIIDDLAKQTSAYKTWETTKLNPALEAEKKAGENIIPDLPKGEFTQAPAPKKEEGIGENPFKLFANTGAALGTLLSFKSRRPLVASMEALTAAGQAINKKDYDDYAKQMENWQEQNKLALETAKQQSAMYKSALTANMNDFNSKSAIVRSLVAGEGLDQHAADAIMRGRISLQEHADRLAATAEAHRGNIAAANDRAMTKVDTMLEKNPRLARAYQKAVEQDPTIANDPHRIQAMMIKTTADTAGAFGAPALNVIDNLQAPNTQAKTVDTLDRIKNEPAVRTAVSNNVRFRKDAVDMMNTIATDPDAVGWVATMQQKIAPQLAAYAKTVSDPTGAAYAQKYAELESGYYAQALKDNPDAQAQITRTAVVSKQLARISLEDASAIAKPTVFLDRMTGGWYNEKQGADALVNILYSRATESDRFLKDYNLDSSTFKPEVKNESGWRALREGPVATQLRAAWETRALKLNPWMTREEASVEYDKQLTGPAAKRD